MHDLAITEIFQKISFFIEQGVLDRCVIDTLRFQNGFVPKETELWDYKQQSGSDAVSQGKMLLQVVCFHNKFGGYLIYGIRAQDQDTSFEPCGIQPQSLDCSQIKRNLKSYTGKNIDLSYLEIPYTIDGREFLFGLLHIPKRREFAPVLFEKNGPEIEKGKPLFKKNKLYIRALDECIPAEKPEDLQALYSSRENPYINESGLPLGLSGGRDSPLENNLPDRNLICPKFIGRDSLLEQLWAWFGDEFSRCKLLAGDGGKGKTSIAYEFAEQVCRAKPGGINAVIWLTAKRKQFSGIENTYMPVPNTHFSDLQTLLKSLCAELAVIEDELEAASGGHLKRITVEALTAIPCFVIIDDLDSLELDQQKQVLEIALSLSSGASRILVTTRMNQVYSTELSISVPGLAGREYEELVNNIQQKFDTAPLSMAQINHLVEVTDGSPLYTESIFRLIRNGEDPDRAIDHWKGHLGEEVRKAALLREVEILSPESRRILFVCSELGEASITELCQATGYSEERINRCLNELRNLFLISKTRIIQKIPRFGVSENTARLVLENSSLLIADPGELKRAIQNLRKAYEETLERQKGAPRRVGAAIRQAMALLKDLRHDEAIETAKAAVDAEAEHPDLVMLLGRCLGARGKQSKSYEDLSDARKAYKKAYDKGLRKEQLFELWYDIELSADHPNGAVEVASLAISQNEFSLIEWRGRRAKAYWLLGLAHQKSSNRNMALDNFAHARDDIKRVLGKCPDSLKTQYILSLYKIADMAWDIAAASGTDYDSWIFSFDFIAECIVDGDHRVDNFRRLLLALENAAGRVEYDKEFKGKKIQDSQRNSLGERLGGIKSLAQNAGAVAKQSDVEMLKNSIHKLADKIHRL